VGEISMHYMVKYLKEGKWITSSIVLPDSIDAEVYVEKHMAKDFTIYMEAVKSKERIRKELLVAESKFDLLRQG